VRLSIFSIVLLTDDAAGFPSTKKVDQINAIAKQRDIEKRQREEVEAKYVFPHFSLVIDFDYSPLSVNPTDATNS